MWCTQRDLTFPGMVGKNAGYITRNATIAVTFTDGVGGLAVDELKARRSYYILPCARNATLK